MHSVILCIICSEVYKFIFYIFSENQSLDVLALAAENELLKRQVADLQKQNELFQKKTDSQQESNKKEVLPTLQFGADFLRRNVKKDDFQYYTGLNSEQFLLFRNFIAPVTMDELPFKMMRTVSSQRNMSVEDQVLLVLIKIRHNFDFRHLGNLFGISQQDASTIFSNWIKYMFHRCSFVSIWPHRNTIIEMMPEKFKSEFPNTLVIIDGTEMRIQRPSSMTRQSQSYSDYKSSNTLKGLVGVDPRGSIIFASMLYLGAISDKELTSRSGFLKTLEELKSQGKIIEGDGIMVDKGFRIREEVEKLGLKLNIPPFASSGTQMSASDIKLTEKIARHRVHVERAIARIKTFKILSNRIDLKLFTSINQIWYVCCFLTNFMNLLIK